MEMRNFRTLLDENKKVIITFGLIGAFLGFGFKSSQAAIAVTDLKNIAEQIKTYGESVKIVTNTAQMITLEAKQLLGLPEQVLNNYKNSVTSSISNIEGIFKNAGGIFNGTEMMKKEWEKDIQVLGSDQETTVAGERNAKSAMLESSYQDHQKIVTALAETVKELDKSNERLLELQKQNAAVEGTKQALQIQNDIAHEQAHINLLRTNIDAYKYYLEFKENQKKVAEEKNQLAVQDAEKKANLDAIAIMRQEVTKTMPVDSLFFSH